tara:strand:+ start:2511 stop:3188 length:678 start_codon:yes stop_codon:yes gene_type:complete
MDYQESDIRWDRVEKLAKLMRSVANDVAEREKTDDENMYILPVFELDSWFRFDETTVGGFDASQGIPKDKIFKGEDGQTYMKEGFCGTAACVLGHAAFLKDFIDEGLRVRVGEREPGSLYVRPWTMVISYKDPNNPNAQEYHDTSAGHHFFQLPFLLADLLFATSDYAYRLYTVGTPKEGQVYDNEDVPAEIVADYLERAVANRSFGDWQSFTDADEDGEDEDDE